VADTLSFGYDGNGGLGDRLLAAVLRGEKTATSLAVEYLSGEPLPRVGERLTLVDHGGRPHGVVETTRVTIVPLHLVGNDVARDEGEGFADAAQKATLTWPSGRRSPIWCAPTQATPSGSCGGPSPSLCTGSGCWGQPQHLPRAGRPSSRSACETVDRARREVRRASEDVPLPVAVVSSMLTGRDVGGDRGVWVDAVAVEQAEQPGDVVSRRSGA